MARKEVNLSKKTLKKLQKLADEDKRKLKPFMEKILEDYADAHRSADNEHQFPGV